MNKESTVVKEASQRNSVNSVDRLLYKPQFDEEYDTAISKYTLYNIHFISIKIGTNQDHSKPNK